MYFKPGDYVTIIDEPMRDMCLGWAPFMSEMCGETYPIQKVLNHAGVPTGKVYMVNDWNFTVDCFQEYYGHPETLTDDDYDLLLTEVSI